MDWIWVSSIGCYCTEFYRLSVYFTKLARVLPNWIEIELDSTNLYHCTISFDQLDSVINLGFTGFYWISLGFTRFYWALLGFTKFYWVSLSFTGFYWVLLGFPGFYWVSLGFTGF